MLKYDPIFTFDPTSQNYMVEGPSAQRVAQDILVAFHKDVEGKIRQALIDQGWTPPVTKSTPSS